MSDQKRAAAEVRTAKLDKSEPYHPKAVQAGANVAGQKKGQTFSDSLKTRADDPRNWEFYFEDSAAPDDPWSPKSTMGPRARAAADRKQLATAKAKAKSGGAQLYRTLEIEFDTKNIVASTKQAKAVYLASGPTKGGFGSTAAARNVAAQKGRARRGGGGGQGRIGSTTSNRRIRGTATGRNIAAQRERGVRQAGRGSGKTTSPFGAATQNRSARIA